MKRFLFISLLYLISFSVLAQKVTIQVLQTKNPGLTAWQIIDNQNITVFSGNEYLQKDTVTFSLDANRDYFLKISVSENTNPDISLCTLCLNGEPILFIKSDVGNRRSFISIFHRNKINQCEDCRWYKCCNLRFSMAGILYFHFRRITDAVVQ